MARVIELSYGDLGIALIFVALVALVSRLNRLWLEKDLAVGAVRTFVQLIAVGYVLKWVFGMNRWYLVLLALAAMCITGGVHAAARVKTREAKTTLIATAAVIAGSAAVIIVLFGLVVRVTPWYSPQYVIPLSGMIINAAMNGASVGMASFQTSAREQTERLEAALAAGASSTLAARPYVQDAVKKALIPTVNQLMTVGIVQLPGGMTGLILAGTDPRTAVRYQIVIMYMIAATAAAAAIAAVLWYARTFFTPAHQLREQVPS